jgi:hypothetical protein
MVILSGHVPASSDADGTIQNGVYIPEARCYIDLDGPYRKPHPPFEETT